MISSAFFAGFGLAIYMIFEKKVPEFLEFLTDIGGSGFGGFSDSDEFGKSSSSDGDIRLAGSGSSFDSMSGGSGAASAPEKLKDGKYGDHIVVNNITFKNEPKMMAEAVRTIMAQDDMETPAK